MQSKTSWWLPGITVVATATATLAILEYAHRCPESHLAKLLRRLHLVAEHSATSAPRVKIEAASPTHPSEQPAPASLPPDILDHTLRDLRLLDRLNREHPADQSIPENTASFCLDEFSPEKIPVPPRTVQAQDTSSPTATIPDGRPLAPVISVETLPVAPQPQQSDLVPSDLDDETSELEQAPPQNDYPSTKPISDSDNATPAQGAAVQVRGHVLARCNSSGSITDLVECLREWLAACSACAKQSDTPATQSGCSVERGATCTEPLACRRSPQAKCPGSCEKVGHTECTAPSAPCPCTEARLIRRIYPVADLIESHEDGATLRDLVADFVYPGAWQHREQASPPLTIAARACAAPSDEDREFRCAQAVACGKIEYFPGTRCLIVLHTAEVQKQVSQFLKELRRAAHTQESQAARAHGCIPCPLKEPDQVLVVPVIRPVLVPVPVPVGLPEQELPLPRFPIPQHAPADDDLDPPAGRFEPPATPEKLPNCERHPIRLGEVLRRFWENGRGAMPELPIPPAFTPQAPIHPHALPVLPKPANPKCPKHSDPDDCPDLEDFQPLETDLTPPIG